MGLKFASEALDLGGRVLICCPSGCRLSVCCVVALLMLQRRMRLSTAVSLVRLHEPAMRLSRSLSVFLCLYEIELHHETSVPRDRNFSNPSQKKLVEELELQPALPWPLFVYLLVGYVVIPDRYRRPSGKRASVGGAPSFREVDASRLPRSVLPRGRRQQSASLRPCERSTPASCLAPSFREVDASSPTLPKLSNTAKAASNVSARRRLFQLMIAALARGRRPRSKAAE